MLPHAASPIFERVSSGGGAQLPPCYGFDRAGEGLVTPLVRSMARGEHLLLAVVVRCFPLPLLFDPFRPVVEHCSPPLLLHGADIVLERGLVTPPSMVVTLGRPTHRCERAMEELKSKNISYIDLALFCCLMYGRTPWCHTESELSCCAGIMLAAVTM